MAKYPKPSSDAYRLSAWAVANGRTLDPHVAENGLRYGVTAIRYKATKDTFAEGAAALALRYPRADYEVSE